MTARFVTVALACLLACPGVATHSAAPEASRPTATQPRPTTRPACEAESDASHKPFGENTSTGPIGLGKGSGEDAGEMLRRMMAYTLVILVLGGVGLFVVKKVLPKLGAPQGRNISVLETVYLGPKKSLHLLRVGTQRFLVAGSRDEISMLGEVTSAFPDGHEPVATPGKAGGFLSILKGKDVAGSAADKS